MASDSVPLASVLINSKGYCVFCLKKTEPGDNQSHQHVEEDPMVEPLPGESQIQDNLTTNPNEIRQQFCSNIGNYLGASFSFTGAVPRKQLTKDEELLNKYFRSSPALDISDICQACSIIVENFCHNYFQMKSWELQVEWQVRKLKSVMAFAERAVRRKKQFKEQFRIGKRNDRMEIKKIEGFRKELLEKCTFKLGQTFPRIVLKRRHETAFDSTEGTSTTNSKKGKCKISKTSVAVQTESVTESDSNCVPNEEAEPLHANSNNNESTTISLELKDSNTPIANASVQDDVDTMKEEPTDDYYEAAANSPQSCASIGVAGKDKVQATTLSQHSTANADVNEDVSISAFAETDIEIKPVILRIVSVGRTTTSSMSVIPEIPAKQVLGTAERPSFFCPSCKESFSTDINLKSHVCRCLQQQLPVENVNINTTEEVNSTPTPQPDLPGALNSKKAADSNNSITKKMKMEQCTICKTRIKCEYMKAHMSGHTSGIHHKCRYCRTEYASAYHLKRHKVTVMHKLNKKRIKRKRKHDGGTVAGENVTNDGRTNSDNTNIKIVKIIYVTDSPDDTATSSNTALLNN